MQNAVLRVDDCGVKLNIDVVNITWIHSRPRGNPVHSSIVERLLEIHHRTVLATMYYISTRALR